MQSNGGSIFKLSVGEKFNGGDGVWPLTEQCCMLKSIGNVDFGCISKVCDGGEQMEQFCPLALVAHSVVVLLIRELTGKSISSQIQNVQY
ncbi:hypothetical protein T4D_8211 [Trichinella pseudospiralis]|uniref:Uncharacterized protein n=1 Tax=Trichinella pseudospiralis TaxID=6337 RepID=A0A0V1G3A7_TRIPS|nr:hypothetical protein T4D_8211 [Trichinella pseudospiralis]